MMVISKILMILVTKKYCSVMETSLKNGMIYTTIRDIPPKENKLRKSQKKMKLPNLLKKQTTPNGGETSQTS